MFTMTCATAMALEFPLRAAYQSRIPEDDQLAPDWHFPHQTSKKEKKTIFPSKSLRRMVVLEGVKIWLLSLVHRKRFCSPKLVVMMVPAVKGCAELTGALQRKSRAASSPRARNDGDQRSAFINEVR